MGTYIGSITWLLWIVLNKHGCVVITVDWLWFLGYMPESGIAGSNQSSIFILWGTFKVAVPLYIPTTVYNVFFSPPCFRAFVICFPDDSHSNWSEMEPQCHFDLHFLNGQRCWTFFSCICWLFVLPFLKNVFSVHLPISWANYLIFWFLIFFWTLHILDINPLPDE
jgi:hypothetical protein